MSLVLQCKTTRRYAHCMCSLTETVSFTFTFASKVLSGTSIHFHIGLFDSLVGSQLVDYLLFALLFAWHFHWARLDYWLIFMRPNEWISWSKSKHTSFQLTLPASVLYQLIYILYNWRLNSWMHLFLMVGNKKKQKFIFSMVFKNDTNKAANFGFWPLWNNLRAKCIDFQIILKWYYIGLPYVFLHLPGLPCGPAPWSSCLNQFYNSRQAII